MRVTGIDAELDGLSERQTVEGHRSSFLADD